MRVKSAPLFKILKSAKISQNTIILHKYLFNNLYFLGITCDIFRTDTFNTNDCRKRDFITLDCNNPVSQTYTKNLETVFIFFLFHLILEIDFASGLVAFLIASLAFCAAVGRSKAAVEDGLLQAEIAPMLPFNFIQLLLHGGQFALAVQQILVRLKYFSG